MTLPTLTTAQARELETEKILAECPALSREVAEELVPPFPEGSPEYIAYRVRLTAALRNADILAQLGV